MLAVAMLLCSAIRPKFSSAFTPATVESKTATVDGLNIFYREAGPKDAPVIILLHGFPSSSSMFKELMPLLADSYHVIAPDYPGFGHSDAPSPDKFRYTFDHLADVMDRLLGELQLTHYALYLHDYGGPIGLRIALAHPERVTALIVQNAVTHEEGLSEVWEQRRAFWKDPAGTEDKLRKNFLSLDAARQRHIAGSEHPENLDPDTWTSEYQFLMQPGMDRIQMDLSYDYRNNVASYPKWQQYLRKNQPPTLVVWGKGDRIFTTAGALAYERDVPSAEIHLLNAGHFALDEYAALIADLIQRFLPRFMER
jgi:pimeloyl-ACP methyl ester carboxylesterase